MAYELSMVEDDDIPLIPESSGLELSDEADISDIIGFIDVDDSGRADDLDLLEAEEAEGEVNDDVAHRWSPEGSREARPGEVEEESDDSGLEPLEEVDFELLLSSIDLSSLAQWDKGPAGAAEADGRVGKVAAAARASERTPFPETPRRSIQND